MNRSSDCCSGRLKVGRPRQKGGRKKVDGWGRGKGSGGPNVRGGNSLSFYRDHSVGCGSWVCWHGGSGLGARASACYKY